MMKEFHSGETEIGKGAVVILEKANPYILSLLAENYLDDKTLMIGDLELLFKLAKLNDKAQIDRYNKERIYHAIRAPKRQRQLYSIVTRKHKSIKPIRFSLEIKEEKEN